ncbi:GNAT family N-acetyltransferase [Amycolatopsis thermoflava]|uniref:Acetyltransferase (GNAT) family protein n=1 Tax=Amycolatopsis thermoflava TaxID=84480 RepID=A0A3N2H9X6_9PSEU|nr:GNAT family N-acetyltransferase [Amycolatopsis thermoflava]ROS45140.1 acetyltransferase (GNAT) family protein [Amycolatopsis thermoflava]
MSALFCDLPLAERIERAEARRMAEATEKARKRPGSAAFVLPVAGGVATFAEAGSPLNKVAGLGFGGVPDAESLAGVEKAFAAVGCPVQVELAHLADPRIGAALTARGYRLESFENVLGRDLRGGPDRVAPPGVEIRPSGDDEFAAWLDVAADGFGHPDDQDPPSDQQFPREVLARAVRDLAGDGVRRYTAVCDGVVAGVASMCVVDGLAQFTGAATLPGHRRRGVQTALLSARIADAAGAGCDLAVVTTQPASRSQHNAQRQGFELLYTRAVLGRLPAVS